MSFSENRAPRAAGDTRRISGRRDAPTPNSPRAHYVERLPQRLPLGEAQREARAWTRPSRPAPCDATFPPEPAVASFQGDEIPRPDGTATPSRGSERGFACRASNALPEII